MKLITNWRKATVADIEADNLLDEATEIHVLGYNMLGKTGSLRGRTEPDRIKKFFQHHIDTKTPVVFHNGIGYDIPLVEKVLGMDLTDLMVIDTLSVSWYLNTERNLHGLDSFFMDYGIAKPKVGNHRWAAPIQEKWNTDKGHETRLKRHYAIMNHRVTQDVRINVALWEDLKERLTDIYSNVKRCVDSGLVDGKRVSEDEVCYIDQYKNSSSVDEYIDRILTFLMFKADCARLKEKTKFKVDVGKLDNLITSLSEKIEEARVELEGVMPQVPQYAKKSRPAKGYKQNGERSTHGLSWDAEVAKMGFADEHGNLLVKQVDVDNLLILKGYEPPNINGHQQIKDFLFSKGWKPRSFKFIKDEVAQQKWADSGFKPHLKPKPRAVPQISIDGDGGKELCPSVVELAETVPEIMSYAKYTTIKHRLDMCKGFKRDLRPGGYLCARVGGYTNTLREQHRELVNLPSVTKPYGEDIRGLLCSIDDRYILIGSDLSGLEDRVKHHFMLPYDSAYVETMLEDDYDAHLLTALSAGMITQKDFDNYKSGIKWPHVVSARKAGKATNYACLPTDNTQVLTSRGWLAGKDVLIGDKVMGYNQHTYQNEWTEVLHTHLYQDAEVLTVGNFDWSVESTPNHRWFGTKRVGHAGVRLNLPTIFTTSEIMREHQITNTAPFYGGEGKVLPHEASLVAWILADGYYKWSTLSDKTSSSKGKRKGVVASIAQASHKYQKEVEETLLLNNISWKEDNLSSMNLNSMKSYRLLAKDFRDFFDRVVGVRKQKHEVDWVKWVLSLSQESLEAFVYSFWLADGDSLNRGHNSFRTFKQNRGKIADALITAGYLLGYNVTQTGGERCSLIRMQMKRPHTTGQRFKQLGKRTTEVFCLTTGLGNFVIRQGTVVTITGNCVYGSGAETLSRTCGLPVTTCKTLIEGYWRLNWSVKAIAEDQCVIEASGGRWLINPINGFAYSLRGDKDRFSTLCQGTGSYFFDIWCDNILNSMQSNWGKRTLTFTAHDENVFCVKDSPAVVSTVTGIIRDSLVKLNKNYNLRRELGCDVQLGKSYAEIH